MSFPYELFFSAVLAGWVGTGGFWVRQLPGKPGYTCRPTNKRLI
jgi:hypothetical protein